MATRIVVMKDGIIQQVDTPQNLYDSPVNVFVAGFIGTPQMNFLEVTLEKKKSEEDVYLVFGENRIKVPASKFAESNLEEYIGKEVIAGIRPECLYDDEESIAKFSESVIEADVEVTELMGAEIYLYLNAADQKLTARVSSRSNVRAGDKIKIALEIDRVHFFDKETERCIVH